MQRLGLFSDHAPMLHTQATLYHCYANVVYCIPCTSCASVYVGQTFRTLDRRLKEHETAVKYINTQDSAVSEHVCKAQDPDIHQHCFLQSLFIQTLIREATGSSLIFISILIANPNYLT